MTLYSVKQSVELPSLIRQRKENTFVLKKITIKPTNGRTAFSQSLFLKTQTIVFIISFVPPVVLHVAVFLGDAINVHMSVASVR